MPLSRLIYASLREPRSPLDLSEIHDQSEARNAVDAITGALVVTPECYVQMLEGEREVVHACYQRIRRDPRHSNVALILDDLIDERLFPDWSMSAVDLSESDALAPYSEGKEFRPEELPRAVVERLFRDVAAELRRS